MTSIWLDSRNSKAKKYKTLSRLFKENHTLYARIRYHKLEDKAFCHLKRKKVPKNFWTKKNILKEAKKYSTSKEFIKNNKTAYNAALTLEAKLSTKQERHHELCTANNKIPDCAKTDVPEGQHPISVSEILASTRNLVDIASPTTLTDVGKMLRDFGI